MYQFLSKSPADIGVFIDKKLALPEDVFMDSYETFIYVNRPISKFSSASDLAVLFHVPNFVGNEKFHVNL